ncbi:MAG TPA: hypothetical protein VGG03_02305 [Thermoanaerobaculia bacterium]|jgi:hypothetical protein
MSQRNRIVFAATVLVAVLSLAAPAPSRAGGFGEGRTPAISALERAWIWLARLWPGAAAPPPTARWEKEGGAIDPDGSPKPGSTAPAPATEEGDMIDPDGAK